MKYKILITGGSGFIGRYFFNRIVKKHKVYSTYNSSKYKKKNYVKINLANLTKTKKLIKKIKPDVIFHFAAMANPGLNEKNKEKSKVNNFIVTKNVVDAMSKSTKIIFLSTDKIYDGYPSQNLETSSVCPQNFYGKQKLLCEKYIKKKIKKYFILRLPIVHLNGHVRKNSLIDQFIFDIKKDRKINVFDNVTRSFVKLNELSNFFEQLILHNHNYGLFNIGTKKYSYYQRLLSLIIDFPKNKKLKIMPVKGNIYPMKQDLNLKKIKKVFNLTFT